jgi:hypothetical protein
MEVNSNPLWQRVYFFSLVYKLSHLERIEKKRAVKRR